MAASDMPYSPPTKPATTNKRPPAIHIPIAINRCELAAQEASHIARRREIWVEIRGETGGGNSPTSLKDGRGSGPQHQKEFAAELADVTGNNKRDVNLKLRRVDKLGDDIRRIVGTSC